MAPASEKTALPDLPPGAPGKPDKPRYKPQFGVIVVLPDETAQASIFEAFKLLGFKTKVVTT